MIAVMVEGITVAARRVFAGAEEEARALKHPCIGTGHLLLGLLREHSTPGADVLHGHGVTAARVHAQVFCLVGQGERAISGPIPFNKRAEETLDRARSEARSLGHLSVAPEHLLL